MNRQRKCKHCKEKFTPFNSFQKFCFKEECILENNKAFQEKKQKEKKKTFRDNDKAMHSKLAQAAFNAYIRARDKDRPCISCGHKQGRQFHAGHFYSQGGHSYLRFNVWNTHKQCSICNNWKSGNLSEYKDAIIYKIGQERFDWLDEHKHYLTKHHTLEYYKKIIQVFKKRIKRYIK